MFPIHGFGESLPSHFCVFSRGGVPSRVIIHTRLGRLPLSSEDCRTEEDSRVFTPLVDIINRGVQLSPVGLNSQSHVTLPRGTRTPLGSGLGSLHSPQVPTTDPDMTGVRQGCIQTDPTGQHSSASVSILQGGRADSVGNDGIPANRYRGHWRVRHRRRG